MTKQTYGGYETFREFSSACMAKAEAIAAEETGYEFRIAGMLDDDYMATQAAFLAAREREYNRLISEGCDGQSCDDAETVRHIVYGI